MDDTELRDRADATLLASWEAYAAGAPGAAVLRLPGAAVAVFPHGFEQEVYNNAVLTGSEGVDAMEAAYREAGIATYAAWIGDGDDDLRSELEGRGYVLDTSTLTMGRPLTDLPEPAVPSEPVPWADYLASQGLPADFLHGADHDAQHPRAIRLDGAIVSAALAFDHDGDTGIFNVGTLEHARRRGLGTALTIAQLHAARGRGSTTATLQSTAMGERVYAAAGFRPLGRTLEFVPGGRP